MPVDLAVVAEHQRLGRLLHAVKLCQATGGLLRGAGEPLDPGGHGRLLPTKHRLHVRVLHLGHVVEVERLCRGDDSILGRLLRGVEPVVAIPVKVEVALRAVGQLVLVEGCDCCRGIVCVDKMNESDALERAIRQETKVYAIDLGGAKRSFRGVLI